MNTHPFPTISSPVSRHLAILCINLGSMQHTEATSIACNTSTFSKHANPPKHCLYHQPRRQGKREGATARRGRGTPRPVEAEPLPGNAMGDTVMRVITKVEQTLGAWSFSVVDQDRHVSAEWLHLATQHDRWHATDQELRDHPFHSRVMEGSYHSSLFSCFSRWSGESSNQ